MALREKYILETESPTKGISMPKMSMQPMAFKLRSSNFGIFLVLLIFLRVMPVAASENTTTAITVCPTQIEIDYKVISGERGFDGKSGRTTLPFTAMGVYVEYKEANPNGPRLSAMLGVHQRSGRTSIIWDLGDPHVKATTIDCIYGGQNSVEIEREFPLSFQSCWVSRIDEKLNFRKIAGYCK